MSFWIIVIAVALICGGILARAALISRSDDEPPAAYDLKVYRDQLKEIDRDLARGVLSQEDADRTRIEVSRRILAADAMLREHRAAAGQPALARWALVILSFIGLAGGGGLLYAQLGAPGYSDLPLAQRIANSDTARMNRLTQAEVEARIPERSNDTEIDPVHLALVEQLRTAITQRPDDLEGLTLLVEHEARLGNFAAAHKAQSHIIAIKGPDATSEDYAVLADLMVTAAQGYVSRDAETALQAALARNPQEPRARYYLGVYMMQVDRPDSAFRLWRDLLESSRPEDPWVPVIASRISDVAARAGVRYDPPELPGLAGPTEEDIAAASQMSAEDREIMIRGMVASLSGRLSTSGGTAEEWARLIRAYSVLGEYEQAQAIWREARELFSNDASAMATLRATADQVGLLE